MYQNDLPTGAVLVCGAGITGIQASLDLAESGFKVYLVDSSPAIGGRMAQLDKTFPTGDCAMCILSPKLVECARNKNIEIITLADVAGHLRRAGQLQGASSARTRATWTSSKCNACGDCTEACPVDLPSEFDRRLGTRKAIFRPYPQAIPNVFGISKADGRAPCKAGLPGRRQRPGLRGPHRRGQVQGSLRAHPRALPAAGRCGRVCQHPCEDECNRGEVDEPSPSATSSGSSPTTSTPTRTSTRRPSPRPPKLRREGGHHRRRPGRPDRGLRPGRAGLRRDHLRGAAAPGRHAALRHSRVPPARGRAGQRDPAPPRRARRGQAEPAHRPRPDAGRASASQGYAAIFVASGAHESRRWTSPANRLQRRGLRLSTSCARVNRGEPPRVGANVLVIGGGDVAMDAARCALRLRASDAVTVACRRAARRDAGPAPGRAAEALEEEGVVFHMLAGPDPHDRRRRGHGDRHGCLPRLHAACSTTSGRLRPAVRRARSPAILPPTRSS